MDNKDSAWKEAIETYFPDFIKFFFPNIAKDIDGSERWLLIHIEVQGYFEKEFAKRMFIYNYRIFDKYNKDVVSLAILADPLPHFRPDKYKVSYWGFKQEFSFPVVKILDYKEKWAELEKSKNPFAIIVMAHLKEMETKADIDNRLFWKITLVKSLYKKGIHGIQQGIRQGLLEAIELGLKLRFGTKGLRLYPQITKIDNVDKLRSIKESIEIAKEVKEIEELLPKPDRL